MCFEHIGCSCIDILKWIPFSLPGSFICFSCLTRIRFCQLFVLENNGTSAWFNWDILLGISVPASCKGIGSSPPYWYPIWTCYKISCVAGTSNNGVVYSPRAPVCNRMGNGRPSLGKGKCQCWFYNYLFVYVLVLSIY